MQLRTLFLVGTSAGEKKKALLLASWFFVTVATLWLLKPVRVASILAHLGASEIPYVRLVGMVVIAFVVTVYSAAVDRLTRASIVRWVSAVFAVALAGSWLLVQAAPSLGGARAFVWAIYTLVELYSVLMIGVFWTYTNDVVTPEEANKLYGMIGLGGILGGVAGGAFVDWFVRDIGPLNLLLVCASLSLLSGGIGSLTESILKPPARHVPKASSGKLSTAFQGAVEVRKSPYLMLMVGIVVAYEVSATLIDFGINVVFEHAYSDQVELTRMYGRLGWIVSVTAIVGQIGLVPLLLPSKRLALVVPPLVMLASAAGVVVLPVIATAMVLAAADRGLNYSIQQATRESLYVPLTDSQKYTAKAFIDMFVDRAAKALGAFALIAVLQAVGESVRGALVISLVSMVAWLGSARRLGALWGATWGALREPVLSEAPKETTERAAE